MTKSNRAFVRGFASLSDRDVELLAHLLFRCGYTFIASETRWVAPRNSVVER